MTDEDSSPSVSGVFAALPTLMNDRRLVDQKAFDHVVDYLLGHLEGLAILTECAEDLVLTADERRGILKSVSQKTEGRKKLVVAISTPSTVEAQELVKAAEAKGTTAVLISLARFPGFGYRELFRHLEKIKKSSKVPILLDARPGNVLDSLTSDELQTLLAHIELSGVFLPQFSPGSLDPWKKRFKPAEAKRAPSFLTASSLSFSRAAEQGATGTICGMAVVAPEQATQIYEAAVHQNTATVHKLESQLRPVVEVLGPPGGERAADGIQRITNRIARRALSGPSLAPVFPAPLIKEALKLQGHPVRSDVRPPFENARPEATERLKTALTVGGLL